MDGNQVACEIGGTWDRPTLAVGLNGLADWSPAQPFLDHFKMARPWTGRRGEVFGAVSFDELRAEGAIDRDGWLMALPAGLDAVSAVLLTEIDPAAHDLAGQYVMTWRGTGDVVLLGAVNQRPGENSITFDFIPEGDNLLEVQIRSIQDGPIRDIRIIKSENLGRYAAGNIFRIEWLDMIRNYRMLRFMDWMLTNDSVQQEWRNRPRPSDAFYTWRGAPVEIMVRLANAVGADAWFNIPHLASDDYITRFSSYIREYLTHGLYAYYEYSNEMWNTQFEQSQWAIRMAKQHWPRQGDGFVQWYAGRAVNMATLLDETYATGTARHIKVISTHTHWIELEYAILQAPDWHADEVSRRAPYTYFDAYAVSGYFDGGLDRDENVPAIRALLAQSTQAQARTVLRNQMLNGGWSQSGRTIANLRDTWNYHAKVAQTHQLDLIMYEGGTHIIPPAAVSDDPELADFYLRFNYSVEMGQVYKAAFQEWTAAGGQMFNLFVECARPGKYGYWGLQRHIGDENSRWAAADSWNRNHASPQPRDPGTFTGSYERSDC